MFTVMREYQFDAAHRLLGHKGKCKNLHGHRYTVVATFSSATLNPEGMVIDYGDIDSIFKVVVEPCDHATLVSTDDTELERFAASCGSRLVLVQGPTTAETLAKVFYHAIIRHGLPKGLCLRQVEVRETPRSSACYQGQL